MISRATTEQVIDLRHAVLRSGLPRETARFPGDDDATARHFVARNRDGGGIIACATLHLNQWQGEPAWQLRGMAVEPQWQGGGIGSVLLRAVEQSVLEADSPTHLLWCNARTPAEAFYRKHGWQVVGDVFDIPTAGPHVKMIKRV